MCCNHEAECDDIFLTFVLQQYKIKALYRCFLPTITFLFQEFYSFNEVFFFIVILGQLYQPEIFDFMPPKKYQNEF